jgi:hypothetical protein
MFRLRLLLPVRANRLQFTPCVAGIASLFSAFGKSRKTHVEECFYLGFLIADVATHPVLKDESFGRNDDGLRGAA